MLINAVNICGEDFFILEDKVSLYVLAAGMVVAFILLRKNLISKSFVLVFFFIASSISLYLADKTDSDKKELKSSLAQRPECIDVLNEKFPILMSQIPDSTLLNYKGKDKKIAEELARRYETGTNGISINLKKAKQIRKEII